MAIVIIILIILCPALGFIAGRRTCRSVVHKKLTEENTFLRDQVEDLKQAIHYWKEQSTYNREIQNTTIMNHNSNLKNTFENILGFLTIQNIDNLKDQEKDQVENIIKTIKSGISSSQFHE